MNYVKSISTVVLLVAWQFHFGQDAVLSAGGEASGQGSLSYSIGQLAYTEIGAEASLNAGVQQVYEVFTGLEVLSGMELDMSIYPNPTSDFVQVLVKEPQVEGLTYRLCDLSGQVLNEGPIKQSPYQLDLQSYTSGSYFLQIVHEAGAIQTLPIIKD